MLTKVIARILVFAIIIALVIIIYLFWSDKLKENNEAPIDVPVVQEGIKKEASRTAVSADRVQEIENSISQLEEEVADQKVLIDNLSELNSISATKSAELSGKKILATMHTKGSAFSTTSTAYTPMNMFVNITCPKQCTLWVDYYTVSKNDSVNNKNTYGIFLNGQDQSLYSQASIPVANGTASVSLNGALPVSPGTYTVEIQAKTTGGRLGSDVSFLNVMALER